MQIEVITREADDSWRSVFVTDPMATIMLEELGLRLPVVELYAGLTALREQASMEAGAVNCGGRFRPQNSLQSSPLTQSGYPGYSDRNRLSPIMNGPVKPNIVTLSPSKVVITEAGRRSRS